MVSTVQHKTSRYQTAIDLQLHAPTMDRIDRLMNGSLAQTFLLTLDLAALSRETGKPELELLRQVADGELSMPETASEVQAREQHEHWPDYPFIARYASREGDIRKQQREIAVRLVEYFDWAAGQSR